MDLIEIGRLRTTHGIHGFIKVTLLSDEQRNFAKITWVVLQNENKKQRRLKIESAEQRGQDLMIKLAGIESPEQGKLFNNWRLLIAAEHALPCAKGEYYYQDLIDCSLIYDGSILGSVLGILEASKGSDIFLEISLLQASSPKKLLPFRAEFIGAVNIADKTIEVLNDWVLD